MAFDPAAAAADPVRLAFGPKWGQGVGAQIDLWDRRREVRIGRLGYQEGGVWQLTSSREGVPWDLYEEALSRCRRVFPAG